MTETYTLAASNYFLLEYGSGLKMLENATILQNDGILDVEALERYVVEALNGKIGQEFDEAQVSITFTKGKMDNNLNDGEKESPSTGDNSHITVWILLTGISFVMLILLKRMRKEKA